jgi:sugar phosphate isomerase/epimerase
MQRREFLVGAAVGAAAVAGLPKMSWASTGTRAKADKLDRISIMTLNFQSILRLPDLTPGPARTLEVMDIAEMLADTYGVHRVEFQHYHIPDTSPAYLKALRARYAKSKSHITQVNLEFGNAIMLSVPDNRSRLMAIDLTRQWIDHAVALGAQKVMPNQGALTADNKDIAIATYKRMVDYGREKHIKVSLETRGSGVTPAMITAAAEAAAAAGKPAPAVPPTGPAAWMLLAEVIQAAGGYSNVDVGGANAANQEELHACIQRMFPFTAGNQHTRVNAKWDLATEIRFLEGLGYKGLYSIETNGQEGTKAVYDVVTAAL